MFVASPLPNHDMPPAEPQYFPEEEQDILSTSSPTPLQRLRIAQAEWSKFFLQDTTNSSRVRDGNRTLHMSVENHRVNVAWGDPLDAKPDNVTRVYNLNANGFTLDRRGGQFEDFCKTANEVQADIVGCQEHNLDTTQPAVKSILYDTARRVWKRSKLHFGTTPIPFANMYKPGGTMLASLNHTTGRVISHSVDKWGRWTSQTLRGKHDRRITIVNVYQVVADTPGTGIVTSATQQRSLLLESEDRLSDPREAFLRDLKTYLKECVLKGDELLVMGDFNERIGVERNPTSSLLSEFGLVNLMLSRHPAPLPVTYARGRKCLDYGFASSHVVQSLVACGYEAFNARYPTDHRPYFFDFDTDKLFGNTTPLLASHAQRTLRSTNVKQVTQYVKILYDLLLERNAFSRARQLRHPGNRHAFAERLDKDMVQASLAAEKRIKRYGEPAWSVTLDQSRKKLSILRKCLSMIRTGLNMTQVIQDENAALHEPMTLPTTKAECCVAIREIKGVIVDNIAMCIDLREAEFKKKIQALEGSSRKTDATRALILRRLQRAEAIKRLFDKLRSARSQGDRRGVVSLEIPVHPDADPKTCSEWRTIDVPSEIVDHLQRRNRKHFGQAHGSPFTVPPLSDYLGFQGVGPNADTVLKGQYDSTEFDDNVRLLLQHLQITQEMQEEESYPTITEKEFRGKLQTWRESTSTSPSGLHLGHWKALIARHEYSDDDIEEDLTAPTNTEGHRPMSKRDEWNHMQNELFDLHLNMLNYALERGYSYKRWQTIVNTVLFKDIDNVKLHRTRIIHIYEADFNLMLGLKWRMAMYQAEALKLLNDGQYGSRPGRNAIDPVMLEELQFEVSRLSRRMLIQTNYDATACYDRIIPNLAMLVSQIFGVHPLVAKSYVETLFCAMYHIRTELGVSPTSYSHSDLWPIYGTGQGSGNSPMIWLFLSCLLFAAYAKLARKATYCNPDGSNDTTLTMVGFVDDTNGQVNKFTSPQTDITLLELMQDAEHNATSWASLLGATGGALELSKCSYHVVFWRFSVQGAPVLMNMKAELPPITVVDPTSLQPQELEYLNPYEAHKTLGYYKEPAGIQVQQFTKLKEKSDEITEFLWKTPLTRSEAWTYYTACYLPSVTYPLTGSYLTAKQLTKVQTRAMSIIIPRCGYNRNTHRSIIYGPQRLGGASFRHLYIEQGILQVTYFLRHWRTQSQIGKLFRCTISWLQLSLGVSYPVLSQPSTPLPHMESKWIASMRSFLAEQKLSIQLDEPTVPAMQREQDSYIMDHILHSNHYSQAEIRKLNYCRLYLNAVTVSDLVKPDGETLDSAFIKGETSAQSSYLAHHGVHQEKPSQPEWKLWRRANLIWANIDGRLRQPLGAWLHPIQAHRRYHFAYQQGHRMWIREHGTLNEYKEYELLPSSSILHDCQTSTTMSLIPPYARPVEVHPTAEPGGWHHTHPGQMITPQPLPSSALPDTFTEYVQTLEEWERELLQFVDLRLDPFEFCVQLQPHFTSGCDGSVIPTTQHSAFGWSIRDERGTTAAQGMGPAPGSKPTSYRAEAYGMLSLMRFLIRMAEYNDMHWSWKGVIGTDSQSLLDTLNGKDKDPQEEDTPLAIHGPTVVLDVLCPDWDILIEIQHAKEQLPDVTWQYVQGHQDRDKPYATLSTMAQLNVDADRKAAQFQAEHGEYRGWAPLTPRGRCHLVGLKGTITSSYAKKIRYMAAESPLRLYMLKKYEWSPGIYSSINWEAHGSALKKLGKRNIHYTKLVHDILPTTHLANKYDKGNRTCPQCQFEREDRDHVLRCPSQSALAWRTGFQASLLTFFQENETAQELMELALSIFELWFQTEETLQIDPQYYPARVTTLIHEQNAIGWRQLFNGRFSKEWSRIQDESYGRNRPPPGKQKRTGMRWQTRFILKIWEQWDDRWSDRNKTLHGQDATTRNQALRRETQRQLDGIYQQRQMMEPQVQALLLDSPEDHVQQSVTTTRNWISTNRRLFRQSVRRVKASALRGVRSLRTYFQPGNGG
jgi:exonuclease III